MKEKKNIGHDIYSLIEELYPICRSITGAGVRETLTHIQKIIPVKTFEVPSGTNVFDWTVPKEWNIRDAYIKDPSDKKIVDFKKSNLHVVGYSVPIHARMTLEELKPHLFTLPKHPTWIPYLTSYYKEFWGFCLAHNDYKKLKRGTHEVVIDSSLENGALTYGEFFIPGKTQDEFLISTYLCHPSTANDNLSGIALTTFLARELQQKNNLRYSYRFLFLPETIGAITWLARNGSQTRNIKHGLVATCVGDKGMLTYKKSRRGDAEIDRVVAYILKENKKRHRIVDFFPSGSDERQYCSPGFNLPVGSLMRTPYDEYPEYHTSADNLSVVKPAYLLDTFNTYLDVIDVIENNETYISNFQKGEPQLGKRGVYPLLGSQRDTSNAMMATMWVINLSDGTNSLLDIAEKSKTTFKIIQEQAGVLLKAGVLRKAR